MTAAQQFSLLSEALFLCSPTDVLVKSDADWCEQSTEFDPFQLRYVRRSHREAFPPDMPIFSVSGSAQIF